MYEVILTNGDIVEVDANCYDGYDSTQFLIFRKSAPRYERVNVRVKNGWFSSYLTSYYTRTFDTTDVAIFNKANVVKIEKVS